MRYRHTRNDFVDWDWTLYTLLVPGSQNPDLYGGADEAENSRYVGGGIDLKRAGFGFGVHAFEQSYLLNIGDGQRATVRNVTLGPGIAYAHELLNVVVGAFAYYYAWNVREGDGRPEGPAELSLVGAGSRFGILWRPEKHPLRMGLVYRGGIRAADAAVNNPDFLAGHRPGAIALPSRLTFGTSYMFGDRKYNPHHTFGLDRLIEEEEPGDDGRRYLLLSYDLVLTAASNNAISMRGFLRGAEIPAGEKPTLSFRAGAESEVLANWLVLRAGYYYEPPRTQLVPGRHHGTGGFAFRLPFGELIGFWPWDLRVDAAFDFARDYSNAGLGLGFWH
jgi:hypothetical protein